VERFETPLAGGAAASMCASAFCWHTACPAAWGGTRPPRLSPGGNGKGGVQTSLLPQAVRAGVVGMPGTRLVYCVLALLPRFSPLRSPTYMSIRSIRFSRSLASATPLLCRASIRTLSRPRLARCKLGSDLKPRSITTVTDLGCWVLPSCGRSLKDQADFRSHPNKAVDFAAYQNF
jgi:hypothetical protein